MSTYDWDPEKAHENLAKHGVSFEEADTVPDSDRARWVVDHAHSTFEERFRVIGYSSLDQLLVVVTSEGGRRPRLISARRATKRERHAFEDRPRR